MRCSKTGYNSRRRGAGLDARSLLVGRRAGGAAAGVRRCSSCARRAPATSPAASRCSLCSLASLLTFQLVRAGQGIHGARRAIGRPSALPRRRSADGSIVAKGRPSSGGLSCPGSRRSGSRACSFFHLRGVASWMAARRLRRAGECAPPPSSGSRGSIAWRARLRVARSGGPARIVPGGSAGGDRLSSPRDPDAGGPAGRTAGRPDRIDSAARAGAHTAARLPGQPDADRGRKPGLLSSRRVVDFRRDARGARKLL